jgi:hypothetical protein
MKKKAGKKATGKKKNQGHLFAHAPLVTKKMGGGANK